MKDIFIIIPTLNPNIELLDGLLKELKKEFKNILVYNDGSRKEYDKYFDKLSNDNIIVLKHYINLGKGRAMKDAFNYLLNNYPKLKGVVTADSDGQHSVIDIKKCAQEVLDNPNSLILGCRDFNSKDVPRRNKFGNKTTSAMFKVFLGIKISDTQTGLRGLSKEVMLKLIDTTGERFEYETNQLIETGKKDIPIKEVSINTIYDDTKVSESHFNPIKDSIAIYKLFLKYIMAASSSFIIDLLLFTIFIGIFNFKKEIIVATIIARIISSLYNYLINSKLVFQKKNKKSIYQFAILCLIQMFVSAFVVDLLANILTFKVVVIKIIIDMIIFVVNFIVERELIFKNEKEK